MQLTGPEALVQSAYADPATAFIHFIKHLLSTYCVPGRKASTAGVPPPTKTADLAGDGCVSRYVMNQGGRCNDRSRYNAQRRSDQQSGSLPGGGSM